MLFLTGKGEKQNKAESHVEIINHIDFKLVLKEIVLDKNDIGINRNYDEGGGGGGSSGSVSSNSIVLVRVVVVLKIWNNSFDNSKEREERK